LRGRITLRIASPALVFVAALVLGCGNAASSVSSASASAATTTAAKQSNSAAPSASQAGDGEEKEKEKEKGPPPLAVGDPAPDVTFTLADGKTVPLSSEKGKLVLVYFYPEDETKGCTIEAEGLRDASKDYAAAGIDVFGVSMQGAESHKAFSDKHSLKFPLAVDEEGSIATAFHVPHHKKHAKRQSFLIGKDGKIKALWLDVKPEANASAVLAAAKS
jgi:peroxiredoxin Q/BCP